MPRPVAPTSPAPAKGDLLLELETRQDEVLIQLAELEQRVERALAEFVVSVRPQERKAA
jgi:hypothetical protein